MINFLITCGTIAMIGLPVIILAGIYEQFVTRTATGRAFERWLFKVLNIDVSNVDDDDDK